MKRVIDVLDQNGSCRGLYGGTSAGKAYSHVVDLFGVDPGYHRVADYLKNRRAAITRHQTDYDLLLDFCEEHKEEIHYKWIKEDKEKEMAEFCLLLTSVKLLEAKEIYGVKVVGLDSVWKWTRHRIPIWLVVVETPKGGLVVAYIISTDGTHHQLSRALAVLFPNHKPLVMIDHDDTERLACHLNGVSSIFLLHTKKSSNSCLVKCPAVFVSFCTNTK